jgi:hypothetical protein
MTNPKRTVRDRSGALYAIVGDDLLAALDAWVEKLNAKAIGPRWTRQGLVRAVLTKAVAEHGKKGTEP